MLTTIKQSDNNVKYNKQKNRITVQALTTDKPVEMGTTKTVDPNYQTFKPYELDNNVFQALNEQFHQNQKHRRHIQYSHQIETLQRIVDQVSLFWSFEYQVNHHCD